MVPDGWAVQTLSAIAEKISDGIHSTPIYADQTKYFFINGNNLKNGRLVITPSTKCVSKDEYLKHQKDIGNRTLLISINGTIGNVAIYSGESVVLGKSAAYLNLKDTVLKEFIYYYLISSIAQRYFISELTGTTIRNLSLKSIKEAKFSLPPLSEQRKIAEILSTWDKAIETTEALLSTSRDQKRALMQALLTGKRRFPEFEGEEWREVRLGDVASFIKDGTHGSHVRYSEGIEMISAGNVLADHSIDFTTVPKISEVDYQKIHKNYVISKGDILLTVVGTLGRSAMVRVTRQFTAQRSVAIIRMRPKALAEFVVQYLQTLRFQNDLRRRANITAQPGVYLGEIGKILIPNLSNTEMEKIVRPLQACDAEIKGFEKSIADLRTEKKALMQQLLTGKRRVVV